MSSKKAKAHPTTSDTNASDNLKTSEGLKTSDSVKLHCCSSNAPLQIYYLNEVKHHSCPLLLQRSDPNPILICKIDGIYNMSKNGPDIWYLPSDIYSTEYSCSICETLNRKNKRSLKHKYELRQRPISCSVSQRKGEKSIKAHRQI